MIGRARLGERAAVVSGTERRTAALPPSGQRDRLGASRLHALEALRAREYWVVAGFFALIVLIYLWPALIQGHPLLAASSLYVQPPWSSFVPPDLTHYYNPMLVDQPLSYYAWDVLSRDYVRAGVFPAWNPYAFGGTPFFGNPEVAWLSPFTWPLWIIPLNYALGLVAAVKLWLAGFGMYLLVRELRLSVWPGVIAGLSFMFCTFNLVWLDYGVHTQVAIMLPWAVWLVERILRRGSWGAGLGLVAVVALVMTGGHPGTQLHVMSAVVVYALLRALLLSDRDRRWRLRALGIVGAGLALGTLLAAATLLPAQQAAIDTVGALARHNGGNGLAGARMSLAAIRAALFPDWWGRPSEALTWVRGPASYNERALFAGTIPLMLAVAALITRDGWRLKGPFVALGAFGLAVGVRAPVIREAVVHAPLFNVVQDQRLLLLFQFAVATLAAFGLQAVLDGAAGRRRAWLALAAALATAVVAVVTLTTANGALGQAVRYMLHRSGEAVAGVLPLTSVGWLLVFAAAFAALLVAAGRARGTRIVGAAAVLLVALEMLHFAHGFQPMGPASRAIPPRTPAIAFLQRHRADGRIAGTGYSVASDWSTIYGLRDARGYDAPQPTQRFHALWTRMAPNQLTSTAYAFFTVSPTTVRVLSLLGTRYLYTEPEAAVGGSGLRAVYRGTDGVIYENRLAVDRAIVARGVHVAGNLSDEVAGVLEPQPAFDPRRDVVVRRDELPPGFDASQAGAGTVAVTGEQNSRVTLRARLQRPGVVLLDDAWAPGWSVRVDGRPAKALQTDVVLRGVAVPAGEHEIVWSYRVPGLRAGVALSLLALLATLAWAGLVVVRGRRARRAPGAAPAG